MNQSKILMQLMEEMASLIELGNVSKYLDELHNSINFAIWLPFWKYERLLFWRDEQSFVWLFCFELLSFT